MQVTVKYICVYIYIYIFIYMCELTCVRIEFLKLYVRQQSKYFWFVAQ